MTVEFGRALRAYREAKGLSLRRAVKDRFVHYKTLHTAETGKSGFSPETAQIISEVLAVPLSERAYFFLLSSGYGEEKIRNVLFSPSGISLSGTPQEPITFEKLLTEHVKASPYRSAIQTSVAADMNPGAISDLTQGRRKIQRTIYVEALIAAFGIRPEKQAEFMLLARGYPFEVVYDALTAAGATVKRKGELQEGVPLLVQ